MLTSNKIFCIILSLSISMILLSCKNENREMDIDSMILAKVGDNQLMRSDVEMIMPNFNSVVDSTCFIADYVDNWVFEKLIYKEARKSLSNVLKIEQEISNYRELLYIREYYDKVLFPSLKTEDLDKEVEMYYTKYMSAYKLNSSYVKGYYMTISPLINGYHHLMHKLKDLSIEDKASLIELCLGTDKEVYFNDEWTDLERFCQLIKYKNIDLLQNEIDNNLHFPFSYVAGDFRYLVRVDSIIRRGEIAPIGLVRNKIVQIVLNNKKKDLILQKKRNLLEQAENNNNIIKNIN